MKMQLIALDSDKKRISIYAAERGKDYYCPECKARLRVRSGDNLRAHFFHISTKESCRQAGKSEEHLFIQRLIQQQIGQHFCAEEMRFEAISRVADVAWLDKKCVFEVQCSPISAKEVEQRTNDYESAGWGVVWILHEKNFGQTRLTAAEEYLQNRTHYFTDGKIIYDECHLVKQRQRLVRSKKLPITVDLLDECPSVKCPQNLPQALERRLCGWSHYIREDLLWQAYFSNELSWLHALIKWEQNLEKGPTLLQRAYVCVRSLWHFILERSCS